MANEILGQLAQMSAVAIALSYTPPDHGVSERLSVLGFCLTNIFAQLLHVHHFMVASLHMA